MNDIPNRIRQPGHPCVYCGKPFMNATKLTAHRTVCEIVHNPHRTVDDEPFTIEQMQTVMIHLIRENQTLRKKLAEITTCLNIKEFRKVRSPNIMEWLRSTRNITPTCGFGQLHTWFDSFDDSDITMIQEQTKIAQIVQLLFKKWLYPHALAVEGDKIPPIYAPSHVNRFATIYIYKTSTVSGGSGEWVESTMSDWAAFFGHVINQAFVAFNQWKAQNRVAIRGNESLSDLCDATSKKLGAVNFKQSESLVKTIRDTLYACMKQDLPDTL